jgi:hypothetical protein
MTEEDKRKQAQDVQAQQMTSGAPMQITAPSTGDSGAAQPATQDILEDQYGTGFINFGRYGQDSPYTQQFQQIPNASGSLYDPNAPVQAPKTPAMTNAVPDENEPPDPDFSPVYNRLNQNGRLGPIMKPFPRMRSALGGGY